MAQDNKGSSSGGKQQGGRRTRERSISRRVPAAPSRAAASNPTTRTAARRANAETIAGPGRDWFAARLYIRRQRRETKASDAGFNDADELPGPTANFETTL